MDEVRQAYATLGLKPGASLGEIRRRYRALAMRWHPDRHASDPKNQAEANEQMRRLNQAMRALIEHGEVRDRASTRHAAAAHDRAPAPNGAPVRGGANVRTGTFTPGARLSRSEIDRMVEAIGSQSPVDWLLDSIGWTGRSVEAVLTVLAALAVSGGLLSMTTRRSGSVVGGILFVAAMLVIVAGLLYREIQERLALARQMFKREK